MGITGESRDSGPSKDSGESGIRVVQLTEADGEEFLRIDRTAFAWDPDEVEGTLALTEVEWGRTFGALRPPAGDLQHSPTASWAPHEELAGIFTVFSLGLTTPGGPGPSDGTRSVPMAGLSWVGVHPDHRRRGVLTALMRRHLGDLHDQGRESVSGLFAAEPAIYGRFGYGEAASGVGFKLPSGTELRPLPGGPEVSTQMSELRARPDAAELFERLITTEASLRPGLITGRSLSQFLLQDPPALHRGQERVQLVLASIGGEHTGFALVRRTEKWVDAMTEAHAEVIQVGAVDPFTLHALWTRLLGFDLVRTIETPLIGLEDPLLSWLVDARPGAHRIDGLWLRLVDVDRALAARGYAADADVVLEVSDEVCPWNAGRWRLQISGAEAACRRTDMAPDLSLDVRELGAAYLGGRSIAASAAAGFVREHRPGAVAELSAAMRGAVEPAVCEIF